MIMKRTLIILVIATLLTGCLKKVTTDTALLDENDPTLSASLQHFYQLESCTEVKGELFAIKAEPIVRIKPLQNSTVEYFAYQIYLAPLTSRETTLNSVIVEADDELAAFFAEKGKESHYNNIADQEKLFNANIWKWEAKESMLAYVYERTVDNLGNDLVLKQGWNLDEFANKMKNFKVRINYNDGQSETIAIFCEVMKTVASEADIEHENEIIEGVLLEGAVRNAFYSLD